MSDHSSLGYWVRRFLMEHLPHERGLSRNTQQSYRDAFRLLLPFISGQSGAVIDRLSIEDVSPELVLAFLADLEALVSLWSSPEISGWLRSTRLPDSLENDAQNT